MFCVVCVSLSAYADNAPFPTELCESNLCNDPYNLESNVCALAGGVEGRLSMLTKVPLQHSVHVPLLGHGLQDRDEMQQRRVGGVAGPRGDGEQVAGLEVAAADSVVQKHNLVKRPAKDPQVLPAERRRLGVDAPAGRHLHRWPIDDSGAVVSVVAVALGEHTPTGVREVRRHTADGWQ